MKVTIKETLEVWYFKTEEDAKENDIKKAVGYTKTANGIYLTGWGDTTQFKWIKGNDETEKTNAAQ